MADYNFDEFLKQLDLAEEKMKQEGSRKARNGK